MIRIAISSVRNNWRVSLKGSKVLDVGCNAGFFLDVASKKFDRKVIELSRWSADLASMNHLVHRQPYSQLRPAKMYDYLTRFGAIKHFSNPNLEIMAAFHVLKPESLILICTGEKNALLPRL